MFHMIRALVERLYIFNMCNVTQLTRSGVHGVEGLKEGIC